MNYIKAQIESKQLCISLMLDNPSLFGGPERVKHRVSLMQFDIAKLEKQLDAWH
jgi:hypothetical protein